MRKVLIVEDDKMSQIAYREKLTNEGLAVFVATDSTEAYDYLKENTPNLIILDIIIPGKEDGLSILANIRSNPDFSEIPILVISNISTTEVVEATKKMGVVDFIVKSDLTMDGLVQKINNLI